MIFPGGAPPRLEGSFCGKCRKQFVPVRMHCSKCRGRTDLVYLDGCGKLITFTTLYVPPEGFMPPLVMGICEIKGGLRVFGEIHDYRLKDSLEIGEAVFVTEKDGKYFLHLERGAAAQPATS